ncbi:MAG: NUDIX domain-containing protein [Bacteroidota bacterium]
MDHTKKFAQEFEESIDRLLPNNSVDCVIFGYEKQRLKVLLLQWKTNAEWSLPGGFIFKDEALNSAAHRVLRERTGLDEIFLNQFYTFGRQNRARPDQNATEEATDKRLLDFGITSPVIAEWMKKRFVTTGYFALVNIAKTNPQPDFMSSSCEWKTIAEIPQLILDHNEIVEKAIGYLRIQLNYLPIGLSLLPEKFTMQDLQKLYEAILGRPLERSNFQRKILKLGMLVRKEKFMSGAANKAPYLYAFDQAKYAQLIKEGIGFSY